MRFFSLSFLLLLSVLLIYPACAKKTEQKSELESLEGLKQNSDSRGFFSSKKTNEQIPKTCPLCGQKGNLGERCSFCDKKL